MAVRPLASAYLLVSHLLQTTAYWALSLLFSVFQGLWWDINGTHNKIKVSRKRGSYSNSAQVLRIITRLKADISEPPCLLDFISIHHSFVDPDYVLGKDHVSLFFLDLDRDIAVFGECEEGQQFWKSNMHPFMGPSMVKNSRYLIILPMHAFNELAASLPEPKGKLIMLSNTARCGSTLIVQLFEFSGKCVAYNEPEPLGNIANLYHQKGSSQEVQQLTRNIIKMLCKPLNCIPDPEAFVLKPHGIFSQCMIPVKTLYPDATLLFLYRDITKVSQSIYKMSFVFPRIRLGYLILRFHKSMANLYLKKSGIGIDLGDISFKDEFSLGVFSALIGAAAFKKLQDSGKQINAIYYEDVLENPKLATQAIFRHCEVADHLVDAALQAFQQDSQRGSNLSRGRMALIPPLQHTAADRARASEIMNRFGFTSIDEPWWLKDTLHFKTVMEA